MISKIRILLLVMFLCLAMSTPLLAVVKTEEMSLNKKFLVTATTVADTATAIPATAMRGRKNITIRLETTTDTVYLNDSTVATTNGWILDSTLPFISIDLTDGVVIYGRTASGTAAVRSLEVK